MSVAPLLIVLAIWPGIIYLILGMLGMNRRWWP
jgi:hypothetical protein